VERGTRGHSTGREAGQMAHAAGVRRLVLTHYAECATARDLDESAREFFGGDVVVADDHQVLEIPGQAQRSPDTMDWSSEVETNPLV
jgi:ribonuclease Z